MCLCVRRVYSRLIYIYIYQHQRAQREIYACGYHPFQVGARRNITQLLGGKMLRHLSLSPAARAVSAHKQSSPASSCSCALCVRPQLCYRARTDVACGCLTVYPPSNHSWESPRKLQIQFAKRCNFCTCALKHLQHGRRSGAQ
jgi:hypothetical protein